MPTSTGGGEVLEPAPPSPRGRRALAAIVVMQSSASSRLRRFGGKLRGILAGAPDAAFSPASNRGQRSCSQAPLHAFCDRPCPVPQRAKVGHVVIAASDQLATAPRPGRLRNVSRFVPAEATTANRPHLPAASLEDIDATRKCSTGARWSARVNRSPSPATRLDYVVRLDGQSRG